MADLTSLQHLILETLSVQSDGYLCSPDASAFIAVGLEDAEQVHTELVGLQDAGMVEFYIAEDHIDVVKVEKDGDGNPLLDENGAIIPIVDDEGNIQIETIVQHADSGWILTDEGREALK